MDHYDDPLSHLIKPPPNETPAERIQRIYQEEEALRASIAIDIELSRERILRKKHCPEIKVLLLGPSGSGKSTILKNFQLTFTPKALQAEAEKYTVLIYLNVVATVLLLSDVLHEQEPEGVSEPQISLLRELCAQMQPVFDLQELLASWFRDSNSQPSSPSFPCSQTTRTFPGPDRYCKTYEVTVNAGDMLKAMQSSFRRLVSGESISKARCTQHARQVLAGYREDIEAVAQHPTMQKLMTARSLRLEHLPGYFLNDLGRITASNYIPTDDDILRTRMRTLGVSETHFKLESGDDRGRSWVVIDVGGSRHQRAAWAPFFDDMNAIIFTAPIGEFDQYLKEDRTINCLKDTFDLWESIVSNRLLSKAEIILFLNKYDMLALKLDAGVLFSKFITSYKDENIAETAGRYIQKKFVAIHRRRSCNPTRIIHSHFTSATDKSSTMALIRSVRDTLFRVNLGQTKLL